MQLCFQDSSTLQHSCTHEPASLAGLWLHPTTIDLRQMVKVCIANLINGVFLHVMRFQGDPGSERKNKNIEWIREQSLKTLLHFNTSRIDV